MTQKPKVLVTRQLLPEAHEYLNPHLDVEIGTVGRDLSHAELLQKIPDKVGLLSLLVDRVDRDVLAAAPGLKVVANCAVGYNNIDIAYAQEQGIWVTNTPGVLTETTADLTWALLMAAARRIPEAERFARAGKFTGWELDLMLGQEITRKCLGIIGMGRIGRAVALRAKAFRMKTLYFDHHRLTPIEETHHAATYASFSDILTGADFVTLHTTLTDETRHMIGTEELDAMKSSAVLVNVSRGPVVDEAALAEALEKGSIWGAGLDVYEREPEIESRLLALENVVLLPHIGSASYETRLKMAMTAATNLVAALTGKTPPNLI
jgi:glyoxylate reductase